MIHKYYFECHPDLGISSPLSNVDTGVGQNSELQNSRTNMMHYGILMALIVIPQMMDEQGQA